MKRSWVTCYAAVVIIAALLNVARIQPAAAADDPVLLANRAIDLWNQAAVTTTGVYYGGENDVLTWQDTHPADDLIAFGHILHVTGRPDVIDSAGPRLLVAVYRAAFPDLVLTATEPVVDDGLVTVNWTLCGTFQGPFAGLEPTGQRHEVVGRFVFRVVGGQIVETWVQADTISTLIRDGATPLAHPPLCTHPEGTLPAPIHQEGGTPDPSRDDPYYTGA